jgi:hypothetical protein
MYVAYTIYSIRCRTYCQRLRLEAGSSQITEHEIFTKVWGKNSNIY